MQLSLNLPTCGKAFLQLNIDLRCLRSSPRKSRLLAEFHGSDQHISLHVPVDGRLLSRAKAIESAMKAGKPAAISYACGDFLTVASDFYKVQRAEVRVLAARPLRVRKAVGRLSFLATTTFKHRSFASGLVLPFASKLRPTGSFLSTLCHEFCHHLDCRLFGIKDSPHTRGFYQRAAVLYHHARGTPVKQLVWVKMLARSVADRLAQA